MYVTIQPNPHRVTNVTVRTNPQTSDLLTLKFEEGASDFALTLPADVWQRVADALAAAGVTPAVVSPDPMASLAEVPDFLKDLES